MTFDFPALIAHAARTRPLAAGTIIGSGTVSNKLDGGPGKPVSAGGAGYSCIAELRMVETIASGERKDAVPALRRYGAHRDEEQGRHSIFGAIEQTVEKYDQSRGGLLPEESETMNLLDHLRRMARNNLWSNDRLYRAVLALQPGEFEAERTSFFPSIKATLNHILAVDLLYLDFLEEGGVGLPSMTISCRSTSPGAVCRPGRSRPAADRLLRWPVGGRSRPRASSPTGARTA